MTIKSSRMYNQLKLLALVFLPVLATLYFTLAAIWDFPSVQKIVYTIVAIDALLGVMLQISSTNFSSSQVGSIIADEAPGGGRTFTLELESNAIEDIEAYDEVRFKVDRRRKPEEDLARIH